MVKKIIMQYSVNQIVMLHMLNVNLRGTVVAERGKY